MDRIYASGLLFVMTGMCFLMLSIALKPEGMLLAAFLVPSLIFNIAGTAFIMKFLQKEKLKRS
ncbi:hypothetical protein J9317_06475 [Metabacillus sp. KIGAM252]|uniref:Uncharacterized protein n=1 Tax=Metabacillus flavus TaxID=2823519 RepID=A0ABS5LCZ4_9BACI|nr:hypothetical protein [Metabacillus flavus]MBS2968403.1 hypothetical protein [Metabacillus flavus]